MSYYKRSNGLIQMRGSGGKFRKTTLQDLGIHNGNTNGTVYICNVCEKEFIPIVHSGTCCGVDNKRVKKVELSKEETSIHEKINAIKSKPFIIRQDILEIESLNRQLFFIKKS